MELIGNINPKGIVEPFGCGCGCSSCFCWYCAVVNYATDQGTRYDTGYAQAQSQVHT
jgi:hypothetical protein